MKYRILIQWSDEDNCYPCFFTRSISKQVWVTHGDTYEEALKHGLEVMEELILIAQEEGTLPQIPELAAC